MKKLIVTACLFVASSFAFADISITELAIRTEGEMVNGKPFLTTDGRNNGKPGDLHIVGSGTCTISGMTVGFHKTGSCDQNFAMVTCEDGKFNAIIRAPQELLEKYVQGKISISEYPTGFWVPNKCKTAASITYNLGKAD